MRLVGDPASPCGQATTVARWKRTQAADGLPCGRTGPNQGVGMPGLPVGELVAAEGAEAMAGLPGRLHIAVGRPRENPNGRSRSMIPAPASGTPGRNPGGARSGKPRIPTRVILMGYRASSRPFQDKAVAFLLMMALYCYVLVLWRYNDGNLCRANNLAHASIISF
jgi:hypothetical protein